MSEPVNVDDTNEARGWGDFLRHGGSFGGSGYLKDWKDEGSIDVWLTPAGGWETRWAHQFNELGKKRDKKQAEYDGVRFLRMVCHETEAILKRQRKRNDDGSRQFPPAICPFDKTLEHIRMGVITGRIGLTQKVFKFETDQEFKEITAGGFTGLYGLDNDKLFRVLGVDDYKKQEAVLAEMRKAGIERDEVYKEVGWPRMEYLFRVIQIAAPDDGYVIANVAEALGQKVRKSFNDRIVATAKSRKPFNPNTDPLALRWLYDDSKDFSDKFDVIHLSEEEVTPEIEDAITSKPPSLNEARQRFSIGKCRELFEKHCLIEMPWDEIFRAAEEAKLDEKADAAVGKDEPWEGARQANRSQAQVPAAQAKPAEQTRAAPPPSTSDLSMPRKDAGPEDLGCECCGKILAETELRCPTCGAEYDPVTGVLTKDPRHEKAEATAKEAAKEREEAGAPKAEDGPPQGRRAARRPA